MVAALASLPCRCRSMAACASRTALWPPIPCLLRSLLLVQCAMALRQPCTACNCLALQFLAYVLLTAGSRHISSDLLAILHMLSGVLLPVACHNQGLRQGGPVAAAVYCTPHASWSHSDDCLPVQHGARVLLATSAAIQVCAQPFVIYASESTIHEIWGSQPGVVHPLATLLAR